MVALAPAETDQGRDGRTLRRQQSYDRAVDALLDLLASGNPAPTAQEIAARSGISVRTVFRLTEDIESLHAAAVARQMERTAHLYDPLPTGGNVAERIRRLVAARRAAFEAIAPVRRVGDRLAAGSPRIAEGLALHHRILRAQVAQLFARELGSLTPAQRTIALDAADVAAGWETWDQLRRSKARGAPAAAKVVTALLDGVFREPPSPPSAKAD